MGYTITHARGGIPSHIDGSTYSNRWDLIKSAAPVFGLDIINVRYVHVKESDGVEVCEEWYVYRSEADASNDADGTSALFVIGRV